MKNDKPKAPLRRRSRSRSKSNENATSSFNPEANDKKRRSKFDIGTGRIQQQKPTELSALSALTSMFKSSNLAQQLQTQPEPQPA